MKILYGIQGTGNGHISRACAMHESFKQYPELEITWLLSSRDKAKGCGSIDDFLWRRGLTFCVENGRINLLKTLRHNSLKEFYRDVRELDLSPYDRVVCDFEPIISLAARKRGIPSIGLGHQYAFNYKIPMRGANPLSLYLLRNYAPVTKSVGLHWDNFGFPILPPIIDLDVPEILPPLVENKVIVYLPFENAQTIVELFKKFEGFDFYLYHPDLQDADLDHVHTRQISRLGFKQDLINAAAVISNSGFELISECLQLGKRILTKPLHGQMEQLSNAEALRQLNYATVMHRLDARIIESWLHQGPDAVRIQYPDVAAELASWIVGGCKESEEELSVKLWAATRKT